MARSEDEHAGGEAADRAALTTEPVPRPESRERSSISIFLAGDVMTGRGVDQVLAHPGDPQLQEPYLKDARDYVKLAEDANGPIPRPVDPAWMWGDALAELERRRPHARVVNLETSVTVSGDFWPDKHIHYRMHPRNADCLTAARLDVCTLANNHVLDFGHAGLAETLRTLHAAGIQTTGAGLDADEAQRPASVDLGAAGRVVISSVASTTSGVFESWAATAERPGVDLLPDLSDRTAAELAERLRTGERPSDIRIVSIHWGSNWGYEVSAFQRRFAQRLVDGGVHIVHGHSSHHPRPIEVYRGHLILYGCGDLITDYEGITGMEAFRGDLTFLYLASVTGASRNLADLTMIPVRLRRMRLERAGDADVAWLQRTMNRWCEGFGSRLEPAEDGSLRLTETW